MPRRNYDNKVGYKNRKKFEEEKKRQFLEKYDKKLKKQQLEEE